MDQWHEIDRLWATVRALTDEVASIPRIPGVQSWDGDMQIFLVVSESADYVVCNTYNRGTVEVGTENIKVAKPWAIRGVTGFFSVDDEITAHRPSGGTGVTDCEWESLTQPPYWMADP